MAVTLSTLRKMKERGERIATLTAYDASFAALEAAAGVEVILVGDSLGMVVQGQESTLPVTLDEMIYHTRCVRRGSGDALVIGDMPFMSCNTPDEALAHAGRLMKEGGAHVVKIEGGAVMLPVVERLAAHGIPVCAHLGLLPQSVHKLGGYRVQGRGADAETIVADARALADAGADLLVLETVPSALARTIAESVSIPVIGIGAGPDCDGQVLVVYDMLGITPGHRPRFSKDFLADTGTVPEALRAFVASVKDGTFPTAEHSFE